MGCLMIFMLSPFVLLIGGLIALVAGAKNVVTYFAAAISLKPALVIGIMTLMGSRHIWISLYANPRPIDNLIYLAGELGLSLLTVLLCARALKSGVSRGSAFTMLGLDTVRWISTLGITTNFYDQFGDAVGLALMGVAGGTLLLQVPCLFFLVGASVTLEREMVGS